MRTCVDPEQCFSSCLFNLGYCNLKHRCKLTCNTDWDCIHEKTCKKTGLHGEKTCQGESNSLKPIGNCEVNLECNKSGGNQTLCITAQLENTESARWAHGQKTCPAEPTSLKPLDTCEKNLDCPKARGKKTVCKAPKLEKRYNKEEIYIFLLLH